MEPCRQKELFLFFSMEDGCAEDLKIRATLSGHISYSGIVGEEKEEEEARSWI